MAIFEFDERSYIQAVWYCAWDQTDWMAVLFREGSGPWTLRYRFRYYVDDRALDSDDRKSVTDVVAKPDAGAEVSATMEATTDSLLELMKVGRPGVHIAEKLLIRGGSDTLIAALRHQSWSHMQRG